MIFDCSMHGKWDSNHASCCPDCMFYARIEISRLRAALIEARRWFADGDISNGCGIRSEYWSPAYAMAIDMIDSALKPNAELKRGGTNSEKDTAASPSR